MFMARRYGNNKNMAWPVGEYIFWMLFNTEKDDSFKKAGVNYVKFGIST